jgi:hypothetical protein
MARNNAADREPSSRPWSRAKVTLGFCRVIQDGNWEGCLYLDRLPNAAEAVAIRETLGIRKQKAVTEETKARLRSQLDRPPTRTHRLAERSRFCQAS